MPNRKHKSEHKTTIKIDYNEKTCPLCGRNKWINEDYMVICEHCGLIIQMPYPYVSGRRIVTGWYLQKNNKVK